MMMDAAVPAPTIDVFDPDLLMVEREQAQPDRQSYIKSNDNTNSSMPTTFYQAGFHEENLGKYRKQSKKKATWIFCTSDGVAHTVSLTWSKQTGKLEVAMDGTVVWFGRRPGASVFDHRWTTHDYHHQQLREGDIHNDYNNDCSVESVPPLQLHIVATCAPRMNETFRKYDLLINGHVFADLPTTKPPSGSPIPPSSYAANGSGGEVVVSSSAVSNVGAPLYENRDDDVGGGEEGQNACPMSIFFLLYPNGLVLDKEN